MSQPVPPSSAPAPSSYSAPSAEAPGRFVWYDLMTTDAARALPFYTTLFGWRAETMPMGGAGEYTMFHVGDEGLGGMVPLDPAHGVSSHWIAYVTVPNVDAACEQATALGGTVGVPPTDIPTVGRFAVIGDPHGAHVSPFTFPDAAPPEREGPPPDGSIAWHELMTPDPEAAMAFHGPIFGWSYATLDLGDLGEYWIAERGGIGTGGVARMAPEHVAAGARAHWLLYVAVADVDRSAAHAADLGGTVLVPPSDIPGIGRFAVLRDPAGGQIAIYRQATG